MLLPNNPTQIYMKNPNVENIGGESFDKSATEP
jgi:hypothetical protein